MSTSNWYDSLPTPTSTPARISVEDVHAMMADQVKVAGRDFVIVDVRRNDIEDPLKFIHPAAINLPAQSFYQTLPVLYPILSRIPLVIFHCNSSNGRGPRCAGWYQDHVDGEAQRGSDVNTRAMVLDGGLKAWAARYGDEVVRV